MGKNARQRADRAAKRKAESLPVEDWWCIWCDMRPSPERTFKTREHVIAESLGGDRDFRLPRGLVCDVCNRGVLQQIDEEVNLVAPVRWLRADLGIGPSFTEVRRGIKIDRVGEMSIDTTKLGPNDDVQLQRHADGTATLSITTAGPSGKVRAEHLNRGLHRIAYNAIAHARGALGVRPRLQFLRDLVLDLDRITPRAHLMDTRQILPAAQERYRGDNVKHEASYDILDDADGQPEIVWIRIGPWWFYVSVQLTTRPLARLKKNYPWLHVYSTIEA